MRSKYQLGPAKPGALEAATAVSPTALPVTKPQPFQTPLTRVAEGKGDDNVEVSKGALKQLITDFASAGAQNAGPVGKAMLDHAPALKAAFEALEAATKPSNALQEEGALQTTIAEAALPAGPAAKTAKTATKVVADVAKATATDTARATEKLLTRTKEYVAPKPSPDKAMGEVLQGKRSDIKKGFKALAEVDLSKVKTYTDLGKSIDGSIAKLSGNVDEVLGQDSTPIILEKLITKNESGSGREIKRNFVTTALDHLKELYEKTADDAGLADIEDVIEKITSNGLTRLEVNDISRLYNSEFGGKAFGKIGEPLTSVNAQMYENIRKGLKDVARRGMGGTEAEATDKTISSLYRVRDLVTKNAEAVQKLKQRVGERGILEKAGHLVAKYGDILTGGTIRGVVAGLLPRGAGYKVLNALDLEERLTRNLDIIKKAIEAGSEKELTTLLEKLTN